MIRHAWAAEVQSSLDFPHTYGLPSLQKKPVDFPSFASKRVFKLSLISRSQSAGRLADIMPNKNLISPIVGTFCSYNIVVFFVYSLVRSLFVHSAHGCSENGQKW
jgi:hypothetical protein